MHLKSFGPLVILLGFALSTATQESPADAVREPDEQLTAAVQSVLGKAVSKGDVPGAVILVVSDGRVVFQHGYGFSNLKTKTPVDPERTLFYVASVTKTFTATAVMQQVEQGRLDLNANVNTYLRGFHVDSAYPTAVTLANLLTHTAGLDDKNIGYVARTLAETRPLGEYLSRALPPRVRPPGEVTAYSNHGYGLAGYLVEIASERPYADYLEENILRPLGMRRTTARIPLPAELKEDLAPGYGYDFRTERLVPLPLGFRNVPPAGTISATASDMGRFLLAHLQDGRLGETRILQEETTRKMQAQQFKNHPGLPGVAFGFYEGHHRGARLLQHAGGYPGYAALVVLVPELGLGIFVANNAGAMGVNRRAALAVLDFVLPHAEAEPAALVAPADFSSRSARFTGCYHSTRYSKRTIEKLAVWDGQVCVTATPAGTLQLEDRRGSRSEWVEVEPLVFRRTESEELLAFREDAGRITYLLRDQGGFPTAFEKLPWWESIRFQLPFSMCLVAMLASTFTVWPVAAGLSALLRRRSSPARRVGSHRSAVANGVLAGVLAVALAAGLDAWIGNSSYRQMLVYGMTTEMVVLLWAGILFSALALGLAVFAAMAWRRGWWTRAGRIYYSMVALAALLFVVFLAQWNLLGFQY